MSVKLDCWNWHMFVSLSCCLRSNKTKSIVAFWCTVFYVICNTSDEFSIPHVGKCFVFNSMSISVTSKWMHKVLIYNTPSFFVEYIIRTSHTLWCVYSNVIMWIKRTSHNLRSPEFVYSSKALQAHDHHLMLTFDPTMIINGNRMTMWSSDKVFFFDVFVNT